MPKEHPIIARIRDRINAKTAEIPPIDAKISMHQEALAELRLQRAAIFAGIGEDEELLRQSAPKMVRARKAKATKEGE